jgi:F0F1-type ATP synthase membrane subunit b/b'
VAVVAAGAEKKAQEVRNEARTQGLRLVQAARANATRLVADTLVGQRRRNDVDQKHQTKGPTTEDLEISFLTHTL